VSTFSLNELEIATDNFSDRNILSKNGFNMSYKGRLANGVLVAIKRYKQLRDISPANLQTMSIVNAHPNLLRVIGICVTQKEKMIVHPYMANGSVASCLRDRPESQPPLDWQVRKHIVFGAARGLAYLHGGCEQKIVFRDVKAANIYLNEDFDAIIGHFELAIHMNHSVTHVEDVVQGTIGHIAPEYVSKGTISEKSDVFGYGMFLLELVTGKRALDISTLANDEDLMLLDWVKRMLVQKKWEKIVDPDIGGNNYYIEEEVEEMIKIALLCTQENPERRPNMSDIVRMMLELGDGLLLAQKWEYFLVCNEEE
ncbi:hypothetical protein MIMGU_mgv1a025555mg, partial [Erythranthe guttata]